MLSGKLREELTFSIEEKARAEKIQACMVVEMMQKRRQCKEEASLKHKEKLCILCITSLTKGV